MKPKRAGRPPGGKSAKAKSGARTSKKRIPRTTPLPNGGILLSGEELWASAGAVLGTGISHFLFTPGSSGVTRLDQICSLYEQYRVRKAVVKYCPGVGTTVGGRIRYGIDYVAGTGASPTGNLPTTPGQIATLVPCQDHQLYRQGSLNVDPKLANKQAWMYVGGAGRDATAFALSVSNESAEPTPGEFRIAYEVELRGIGSGNSGTIGGVGSLSGTFVEDISIATMYSDTTGLWASNKWGCLDRWNKPTAFSDGALLPESVVSLNKQIPGDFDAARQTGPDGPSICLFPVSLVLGDGVVIPEGSEYVVEVAICGAMGRGPSGENSPDRDEPSGTSNFLPTQWVLAPRKGAGDTSQRSALDTCPYVLPQSAYFVVVQQFTKMVADIRNGKDFDTLPNSSGPGVECQNTCYAHWIGRIKTSQAASGELSIVAHNRNGDGEELTHFMRDVNSNNAKSAMAGYVRVRITAVNSVARTALRGEVRKPKIHR